ncbi:MAG: GIY-YIG nuclease family protein [Saprospirales bacterium]|nr:GIY-YIG nuclease family protein [Saprospirales bacterium]
MKQVLYTLFGYRFIYIGMSTRNPGRLKIGIARDVKWRWKAIDRSMKGKQFPVFCLPCFHASWFESHFHRVMKRFNRPVKGDGGSEFSPISIHSAGQDGSMFFVRLPGHFLLTHVLIYALLSWIWCWYTGMEFVEFQKGLFNGVLGWIQ